MHVFQPNYRNILLHLLNEAVHFCVHFCVGVDHLVERERKGYSEGEIETSVCMRERIEVWHFVNK